MNDKKYMIVEGDLEIILARGMNLHTAILLLEAYAYKLSMDDEYEPLTLKEDLRELIHK